jgi:hypothetical protein
MTTESPVASSTSTRAESTPVPEERPLVRRVLSRVRLIHLAPLLAVLALLAWTLASPMGASPDDDFHLDSIWCSSVTDQSSCLPGSAADRRVVPEALVRSACYAGMPTVSAACQGKGSPSSRPTVDTDRGSFANNYPPVYYATMGLFVTPDILGSVWFMRVVNVLLFVGITTALTCLLPARRRAALIAGWLITTVPLGVFLLASNNPSSWALIGVGSSWLALLGYFESTGRRRIALGALFAVTVIMAAGARGDAAVYTVIGSAIAVLLTFRRDRGYLLRAILPVVMGVVAAAFFFSSQQAGVATSGLGSASSISGGAPSPDAHSYSGIALIAYNLLTVPSLWAGAFGEWGLGWLDTAVPAFVRVAAAGVFAAVAFLGLRRAGWRKIVAVLSVALVLWLLPTYVLVRGGNIVGDNVQPRYLLPLIVVLGGLCILTFGRGRFRLSWLQASLVGAGLVIAEAVSLQVNIRRYVTGTGSQGIDLDAGDTWWWSSAPAPMVVWIVGSLAYAALIVVLIREARLRGIVR